MALTYSQEIDLGSPAPPFNLPAANPLADGRGGRTRSLEDYADARVLVVVFTCNHCPYAKHIESTLIRLAHAYKDRSVAFVAISSNDSAPEKYREDSFEHMAQRAEELQYPFPYLFDESQEVARVYDALCTPDVYVFAQDARRPGFRLKYHGRVDETRPGQGASTGAELERALDEILEQGEVAFPVYPSMGCNIKWKPGNEPELAGVTR